MKINLTEARVQVGKKLKVFFSSPFAHAARSEALEKHFRLSPDTYFSSLISRCLIKFDVALTELPSPSNVEEASAEKKHFLNGEWIFDVGSEKREKH